MSGYHMLSGHSPGPTARSPSCNLPHKVRPSMQLRTFTGCFLLRSTLQRSFPILSIFTDNHARDFLPGASADPEHPILLFTHVPLSRPEGTDCGPLRERGTIREGRGLGYQNLLSPQASLLVLQSLRPAIVFR